MGDGIEWVIQTDDEQAAVTPLEWLDSFVIEPEEEEDAAVTPLEWVGSAALGQTAPDQPESWFDSVTFWTLLRIASAAVSTYHGYARDRSVGWAVLWGILGYAVPYITVPVAFAQGFAQPAKGDD